MDIKEGFVSSHGHNIAYLSINEYLKTDDQQPAIVFIHGILSSINFWKVCVPKSFINDRHWYSLSLPAHHPSKVPEDFSQKQVNEKWFYDVMNDVLKSLFGNRKVILIGHSTGGFVALNLALNKCPNVVGLILIGGFYQGKWGGLEGLLLKIASLGNPIAKIVFKSNLLLSKFNFVQWVFGSLAAHKSISYLKNPLSKVYLTNTCNNVANENYNALFHLFNGISSINIKNQLSKIEVPCYLFVGTHDPIISPIQSLNIIGIPSVKTVVFDNIGHMIFIEAAVEFNESLEKAIENLLNL